MAQVSTSTGTWQALVYEPVSSMNFPDAEPYEPGDSIIAGADIQLHFQPAATLPATTSIRLVQFKKPLVGKPHWEVDRAGPRRLPYFGWDDAGEAMRLPASVRGLSSALQDRVDKERAQQGVVPGGEGGATQAAFIIDTPREPSKVPSKKPAEYRTYAYDETNGQWLGGVQWGYAVGLHDDEPVVSVLPLGLCSERAPPADVDKGRRAWNSADVEDRVPVAD